MAAKALCIRCNEEFPSEPEYQEHKKGGHQTRGISLGPVETGIPQEALPTPEFMEAVQRIEGPKDEPETPISPASQHPSSLPEAQPLNLVYTWEGECLTCRVKPITVELDVADKHFVLAVCDRCKKNLKSREVAKL